MGLRGCSLGEMPIFACISRKFLNVHSINLSAWRWGGFKVKQMCFVWRMMPFFRLPLIFYARVEQIWKNHGSEATRGEKRSENLWASWVAEKKYRRVSLTGGKCGLRKRRSEKGLENGSLDLFDMRSLEECAENGKVWLCVHRAGRCHGELFEMAKQEQALFSNWS